MAPSTNPVLIELQTKKRLPEEKLCRARYVNGKRQMKDRATTIARSTDQPSEKKIHLKRSITRVCTQAVGREHKEEVRPNSLKEASKD